MSDSPQQPRNTNFNALAKQLANNFNFREPLDNLYSIEWKYDIKQEIAKYLPREAIAAYKIASGSKAECACFLLERGLYREPFTYWDWHALTRRQWEGDGDKDKRRLLWERNRGVKIKGFWHTYPSPKQRWEMFKVRIAENPLRKRYVHKLAVSHWMTLGDIEWIAKTFPQLESLDLGNVRHDAESDMHGGKIGGLTDATPDWKAILDALQRDYLQELTEDDTISTNILSSLKWLSIGDWRFSERNQNAANTVLRSCLRLKTLSIRGEYDPDPRSYEDVHGQVCKFVSGVMDNIPATVTTIELRLSLPFLAYFLKRLHKEAPQARKVELDLGAWIQMYPLLAASRYDSVPTPMEVQESAIKTAEAVRLLAYQRAKEAFTGTAKLKPSPETNISAKNPEGNVWGSPRTFFLGLVNTEDQRSTAKYTSDYYRLRDGTVVDDARYHVMFSEGDAAVATSSHTATSSVHCPTDHLMLGQELDSNRADSLLETVNNLYKASVQVHEVRLCSATPESEARSTLPIRPINLLSIQKHSMGQLASGRSPDLAKMYKWLHETFGWQPVFDWDDFIHPKGLNAPRDAIQKKYIPAMRRHFQHLQEAGIPIHVLMGRREPDCPGSSLYWGENNETWQEWLKYDFNDDACLSQVAGLIDTLSIFYDLRNPLTWGRNEEIDYLQPHQAPVGVCPLANCPLKEDEKCPYSHHRDFSARSGRVPSVGNTGTAQKMANKQALRPNRAGYPHLASFGDVTAPPPGENANEHPEDDSDDDDEEPVIILHLPSLHHVARQAAYAREALGWQRFWAAYALKFTRLTILRVRMPHYFDRIGSWRLAKLLNADLGWEMSVYTDERQHIQTKEDVDEALQGPNPDFEQVYEDRIWPAGRFVRRSWIWPEKSIRFKSDMSDRLEGIRDMQASKNPQWADRIFSQYDFEETEEQEFEQLRFAESVARAAGRREGELEAKLIQRKGSSIRCSSDRLRTVFLKQYYAQIHAYETEYKELIEESKQAEFEYTLPQGPDGYREAEQAQRWVLERTIENMRARAVPDLSSDPIDFDDQVLRAIIDGNWEVHEDLSDAPPPETPDSLDENFHGGSSKPLGSGGVFSNSAAPIASHSVPTLPQETFYTSPDYLSSRAASADKATSPTIKPTLEQHGTGVTQTAVEDTIFGASSQLPTIRMSEQFQGTHVNVDKIVSESAVSPALVSLVESSVERSSRTKSDTFKPSIETLEPNVTAQVSPTKGSSEKSSYDKDRAPTYVKHKGAVEEPLKIAQTAPISATKSNDKETPESYNGIESSTKLPKSMELVIAHSTATEALTVMEPPDQAEEILAPIRETSPEHESSKKQSGKFEKDQDQTSTEKSHMFDSEDVTTKKTTKKGGGAARADTPFEGGNGGEKEIVVEKSTIKKVTGGGRKRKEPPPLTSPVAKRTRHAKKDYSRFYY